MDAAWRGCTGEVPRRDLEGDGWRIWDGGQSVGSVGCCGAALAASAEGAAARGDEPIALLGLATACRAALCQRCCTPPGTPPAEPMPDASDLPAGDSEPSDEVAWAPVAMLGEELSSEALQGDVATGCGGLNG